MASSSDNSLTDDVIKRRLLIDGDGMGDERKLNALIKSYLSFVDGDDTEENDAKALKGIIAQTKQLDYVARRTHVAIKVNEEAKELYEDLQEKVQSEIKETKNQIIESKALLEEATKHRKYSMEYDALAKLIESKPDRKMTELKRMGLQLENDTLKGRLKRLEDQLDERKRTISQLGHSMEMVREHLKYCDDKFIKKMIIKGAASRSNGEAPMDVDSTSQSEPPSPAEQIPQEQPTTSASNGSTELKNGTAPPPTFSTNAFDKSKSEKYEDLSESEGDEHS